jgi:hypothetical protein
MHEEHVEPLQTLRPGRGHRGRRALLPVLAPLALLIAVVGAGVLGRAGDPVRGIVPGPEGPRLADADAQPTRRPESTPNLEVTNDPMFPLRTLGVPVRTVDDTIEALRDRVLDEDVVAVAGWLTIRPASEACRAAATTGGDSGVPCPRETILVGSPEPILELGAGGDVTRLRPAGPHLHPVALPGVSLRQLAGQQYRGLATSLIPAPVVIVGRVGDPRLPECRGEQRHCGESISLERIVWVDGSWQQREATITAAVGDGQPATRSRREPVEAAVGPVHAILSEVLVSRGTLAAVDADAAAAVDRDVPGLLWYVRHIVGEHGRSEDGPRYVGWAVIDDASGRVIATNPGSETWSRRSYVP